MAARKRAVKRPAKRAAKRAAKLWSVYDANTGELLIGAQSQSAAMKLGQRYADGANRPVIIKSNSRN
jgi:hypothetical protein